MPGSHRPRSNPSPGKWTRPMSREELRGKKPAGELGGSLSRVDLWGVRTCDCLSWT